MKPAAIMYLVTRTHGLKTHLISPRDIQLLVKAKSLREVSDNLLKAEYGTEISKLPTREVDALTLEEIFLKILVDRFFFITREAQGKLQDLLTRYCGRFEVENIKRVIRAKHGGETIEERNLLPLSREHTIVNLPALIKAKDVEDAISLLRETPYRPLVERLETYRRAGTTMVLEAALDDIYFDKVWEITGKISNGNGVKDLVGEEIDLRNLLIALSLKIRDLPPTLIAEALISSSYKLTVGRLRTLAQARLEDAPDILRGTPYSGLGSEVVNLVKERSASPLERLFLNRLYEDASASLKTRFLDAGYVVAYLLLSECEAKNLVTITTGKQLGLGEEEILQGLLGFQTRA